MDRRSFLKATGACAATAAAATAATAAAATATTAAAATSTQTMAPAPPRPADGTPPSRDDAVTFSLRLPWPDNLAGPSDQARRLIKDIKSISNSRLIIKIGKPTNSSPQTATDPTGDLDFGVIHTRKYAPDAALFFSGLPHARGLSASDLEGWLTVAGGQPLWDDLFSDAQIKPIVAGHLGEMPALWSKTPIRSTDDLSNRKIAVTSTKPDLMRAIGAIPVIVPPSKLKHALADGSIDIVEYGGFQSAMSIGLHEVAKHATVGILNPTGTALTLIVPTHIWQSLSDTDKTIITTCANQNYRLACTENRALKTPLGIALRDHHGVKIHTPLKGANKSWEAVADTFLAHISSSNERAQRINASYSAFKNLSI